MPTTSMLPADGSKPTPREGRPRDGAAPYAGAARPWKRWYSTARWLRRRKQQLADEPLCRFCNAHGLVVPATVADHVEPHRGDEWKFWSGKLQSLCATCHSRDKQREEAGGRAIVAIACDGWPVGS